jgi:hypothetical protein
MGEARTLPPGVGTGAWDHRGTPILTGDVVRFRFVMQTDRPEPEVGFPGESALFEAYGEVRMSPFRGAYIVSRGLVYPVTRRRWMQVEPIYDGDKARAMATDPVECEP